jgi:hypothetical protein
MSATSTSFSPRTVNRSLGASIQQNIVCAIDDVLAWLPDPKQLSAEQRRGIISRYTAVLEGNFIYWMTGAYISVKSEQARLIIMDNLREEVRDSHPEMLRRFATAAGALPTDSDSLAVSRELRNVRLFIGQLSGARIVLMMAFFEGFIQKFMSYLAELAADQSSTEMEYTDVHGVCDVGHTEELFHALDSEMELDRHDVETDLFEGVDILRALILSILVGPGLSAN